MSVQEKLKVLIVDDEKANINVLSQILSPKYTILVAKDGRSAISTAQAANPDLILLDIVMPDINGFETITLLKEDDRTKGIPVIFITGQGSVENEARGFALGAVDYITKPFHNSIVEARVQTHMRMIRYIRMIERLCMIDALTNIPNRRYFDSRVNVEWERAIREGASVSVLMLDLDGFKDANDTYGHAQGDALLRAVAAVLEQAAESRSGFACRLGGDEFAILLPDIGLREAMKIAEAIRAEVEQMAVAHVDGTDTKTTVSVGVSASTPVTGNLIDALIFSADKALYTAKKSGKNRVVHLSANE